MAALGFTFVCVPGCQYSYTFAPDEELSREPLQRHQQQCDKYLQAAVTIDEQELEAAKQSVAAREARLQQHRQALAARRQPAGPAPASDERPQSMDEEKGGAAEAPPLAAQQPPAAAAARSPPPSAKQTGRKRTIDESQNGGHSAPATFAAAAAAASSRPAAKVHRAAHSAAASSSAAASEAKEENANPMDADPSDAQEKEPAADRVSVKSEPRSRLIGSHRSSSSRRPRQVILCIEDDEEEDEEEAEPDEAQQDEAVDEPEKKEGADAAAAASSSAGSRHSTRTRKQAQPRSYEWSILAPCAETAAAVATKAAAAAAKVARPAQQQFHSIRKSQLKATAFKVDYGRGPSLHVYKLNGWFWINAEQLYARAKSKGLFSPQKGKYANDAERSEALRFYYYFADNHATLRSNPRIKDNGMHYIKLRENAEVVLADGHPFITLTSLFQTVMQQAYLSDDEFTALTAQREELDNAIDPSYQMQPGFKNPDNGPTEGKPRRAKH